EGRHLVFYRVEGDSSVLIVRVLHADAARQDARMTSLAWELEGVGGRLPDFSYGIDSGLSSTALMVIIHSREYCL
ncbi:MAG: hypothetical protein V2I38_15195, partial [Alcanivoracaceae bacterium]|nr:hypothetical protein [Alcanivoracaceae bacterium]